MADGKVVIQIDGDNSQFIKEMQSIGKTSEQVATDLAREFQKAGLSSTEAFQKANTQIAQYNIKMLQDSSKAFDDFGNKALLTVTGVATAMIALEKGTREQRDELTKLTTAFEDSGKTATQATSTYKDLFGVMGESDSAVEAAQQLAVLTNNQQELSEWTDIAAGVYTKFDDALKLETLAEGANVTATLGKATGGMVDALEFAGITVDEFDKNLAEMTTREERAQYVTKVLSDTYSDLGETYRQNNKEVIEAREAELDLSLAMAELGSAVAPIVTDLTSLAGEILPLLTTAFEENKEIILASAAALLAGAVAAKGFAIVQTIAVGVKAWTTATTAQTAAQWLLNTAMTANPIGLAVTAIAALTTGIVSLVAIMSQPNEEFKKLEETIDGTNSAIENFTTTSDEAIKATDVNARTADKLIQELKELEKQGVKTEQSQQKYADTVQQLSELYPELNLSINENTGLLDQNLESLEAEAEYLKEQAKMAIYYEERTAAIQTLAEAEMELEENSARYNELLTQRGNELTRMGEIEAEMQAIMQDNTLTAAEQETAYRNLNGEHMALKDSLMHTSLEFLEQESIVEGYTENVNNAQLAVDSASASYDVYNEKIAAQAEANALATESYNAIIAKQNELELELISLQEAYTAAKDSAYNNITQTLGLFNTMETTVGSSVEGMISSLDSQIAYMDTYASNLKTATELGVDEGLLAKLSDGSVESAEILQGLVDDGGENIAELNEKFAKVEEGKDAFSTEIGKMVTDFDNEMDRIGSALEETVNELNQSSEATANTNETINAIVNTAYSGQDRVASAYRALANAANYAYRSTLDINSPSRVFEKNTGYTTEAITGQVKKDIPKVEKSYKDLANSAVSAYDTESLKDTAIKTPESPAEIALRIFGTNSASSSTARSLMSNSQSITRTLNTTNSNITVHSDIYLNDEKIGEAVSPTVNKELASYEDYEERGSV